MQFPTLQLKPPNQAIAKPRTRRSMGYDGILVCIVSISYGKKEYMVSFNPTYLNLDSFPTGSNAPKQFSSQYPKHMHS